MIRHYHSGVLGVGVFGLLLAAGCGDDGNQDDTGADSGSSGEPTGAPSTTDPDTSGGPTTDGPTTGEPTTGEPTTGDPTTGETTGEPEALPGEIPLSDSASPEDVTIYDGYLYASNFFDASVLRVSLDDLSVEPFVPAAPMGDPLTSGWGLRVLPRQGWLLYNVNAPINLMGPPAADGEVRAYDLADGSLAQTWAMPANFQGNSVDVDPAGNIYIGDFAVPRIVRIEAGTDTVTVWKEDAVNWPPGGFGLGGMIVDQGGDAIYVSGGAGFWRVPIGADGSAGSTEAVTLVDDAGADFVWAGADGMTQAADGSVYFAQNDALTEGAVGTVQRIVLDDPNSGTVTMLADSLADPSGVYAAEYDGRSYVFINESQFGYAFGVDQGDPALPYRVLVEPQP